METKAPTIFRRRTRPVISLAALVFPGFETLDQFGPNVEWVKAARRVKDGKVYTSSGVTAGIDMALAGMAEMFGPEISERLALESEYEWRRAPAWDPFAKAAGLV